MLTLSNINKTYKMGTNTVEALKDVSISFRRKEFVSILGPSGCGKTTLLNIIGGLDRYTSGDLEINGISTKKYKDKDWDTYRNHRVGFIFQSYNLIPHQTVLENVEIALTLSGVSKKERKARAIKALEEVGLGDKISSKPNQLSGGQMQRVAIARALVNNPEIILADEPTGALDTETSVQIMQVLKKISKNRLVIMVTHNPELAEKYSTRIVNLLDGKLVGDSKPVTERQLRAEAKKLAAEEKGKKHRMSFFTALSLSFKNLLTKKTRTILVSFAGSIGIIGIAIILAISNGFSAYINKIQEDTLSTYPIEITSEGLDISSIITSLFLNTGLDDKSSHDNDGIYESDRILNVLNSVGQTLKGNNVKAFYDYIQKNKGEIEPYVNSIEYGYNMDLEFYGQDDESIQPNSPVLYKMIIKYALAYLQNKTHLEVTDLGNGNYKIKDNGDADWSQFKNIESIASIKQEMEAHGGETELNTIQIMTLISGLMPGFNLAAYSTISVQAFNQMLSNEKLISSQYDVVAGRAIENADEAVLVLDKNSEADDYILYALGLIPDDMMDEIMLKLVSGDNFKTKIEFDSVLNREYKVLETSDYYFDIDSDGVKEDIRNAKTTNPVEYMTNLGVALSNCTNKIKIVGVIRLNSETENGSLRTGLAYSKQFVDYMMTYHNDSAVVASGELRALDKDNPREIQIYVNSFAAKQKVKDFINKYNKGVDSADVISYTDNAGNIMSTVSTIINAITYVLVAFVGVSLVVSSIMIGVITYISVIERTKEIGVLRSIGASKADIRHVFTAESFIIGLASGLFGILIAFLLTIPINFLLKAFTGIYGIARLPLVASIVLVAISVLLTLIAGLIPARLAAKKDPVVALRSN